MHCLFDKSLFGVNMLKLRQYINMPFQHGFRVLECSKKIHSFYAHFMDHLKNRVCMLYTNTDLFFFLFIINNLQKALNNKRFIVFQFDLSTSPADDPSGLGFLNARNGGQLSYPKVECPGNPNSEVFVLRLKMYSLERVKLACKSWKWYVHSRRPSLRRTWQRE